MATKTPREIFVMLLSHARQNTERASGVYKEISQIAEDPDVKQALEARAFVSDKVLSQIDQAFKLLGEQPVKSSGQLREVVAEELRKELAEIQNPDAKRIYILARAIQVAQLRAAEFQVLTAAADLSGNYGVGVLLESCLADTLAFVERTRRLIRRIAENRVAERLAA